MSTLSWLHHFVLWLLSPPQILLQLRVPAPAEQPGGGPPVARPPPPHSPAFAPDAATGEACTPPPHPLPLGCQPQGGRRAPSPPWVPGLVPILPWRPCHGPVLPELTQQLALGVSVPTPKVQPLFLHGFSLRWEQGMVQPEPQEWDCLLEAPCPSLARQAGVRTGLWGLQGRHWPGASSEPGAYSRGLCLQDVHVVHFLFENSPSAMLPALDLWGQPRESVQSTECGWSVTGQAPGGGNLARVPPASSLLLRPHSGCCVSFLSCVTAD